MIEVDQYQRIRFMFAVEGHSQRAIAKTLGVSRNTVRKYCQGAVLPGERKPTQRAAPVTDAVREIVEKWLHDDAEAPRKQRHTAQRIYDRLVAEHSYTGGSSTIRRLVRTLRDPANEAYLSLDFSPGEAAQVDWGAAKVWLNDQLVEVQLFCMRLCYSGAPFVVAFPLQRTEFFLEGHRLAFEYLGGVPVRLFYDNLRTAVKKGWGRQVREEQERFGHLRAHYAFRSEYCNPGAGNEKGLVENLVGFIRRNVLVPVPRVSSWEELNTQLRRACEHYQQRRWEGRTQRVGEALNEERRVLTALPQRPLDTAHTTLEQVLWNSTVRFDDNRYSVPTSLVGKLVVVKGYSLVVEFHYGGELVARHPRQFGKGQVEYQLEHYLELLAKKPRGVRNAQPVRRTVPEALLAFRDRLGGDHPDREFVSVLALIPRHGVAAVTAAVATCTTAGVFSLEGVRHALAGPQRTEELAGSRPELPVKTVNLEDYDQLLAAGMTGGAES